MERIRLTSCMTKGLSISLAGEFVEEAIKCSGKVTVRNGSRQGDAKLIFNVMSLNIKEGAHIEIEIEGGREEEAASLRKFVEENF